MGHRPIVVQIKKRRIPGSNRRSLPCGYKLVQKRVEGRSNTQQALSQSLGYRSAKTLNNAMAPANVKKEKNRV